MIVGQGGAEKLFQVKPVRIAVAAKRPVVRRLFYGGQFGRVREAPPGHHPAPDRRNRKVPDRILGDLAQVVGRFERQVPVVEQLEPRVAQVAEDMVRLQLIVGGVDHVVLGSLPRRSRVETVADLLLERLDALRLDMPEGTLAKIVLVRGAVLNEDEIRLARRPFQVLRLPPQVLDRCVIEGIDGVDQLLDGARDVVQDLDDLQRAIAADHVEDLLDQVNAVPPDQEVIVALTSHGKGPFAGFPCRMWVTWERHLESAPPRTRPKRRRCWCCP